MNALWTPPAREEADERVAWEWRFHASLGLVGVPTEDGRLLLPAQPREARQWLEALPVPVLAFPRVSRPGDGQGGMWEAPVPVARIERVELVVQRHRAGEMIAYGRFDSGSPGDHYRGALAVDAVCLGVDVDRVTPVPLYRATGYEGWRLRGAMFVADSPWPRELLSQPRVWRAPVGAP